MVRDAKRRDEQAVKYSGGIQQGGQVLLGAPTPDEVQAAERTRVLDLCARVRRYIETDRQEVWDELTARQAAQIRQAKQRADILTPELGLLPDAVTQVAPELFEMWVDRDDRDVVGLELWQGVCIQFPHAWFQVEGDPAAIADLKVIYLIDPAPRGLELRDPYLVVPPLSAFALCYAGRRIRVAR